VATYGRDTLIALIKSYAAGTTDDEAFMAALGVDAGTFDAAWRAHVGAAPAIEYGPRPAPPGPVPPGWDVPVVVGGGGTPGPGATSGPSGPPSPGTADPGGPLTTIAIGVFAGLLVGIALILVLIGLRRHRGTGAG